jgi:hypothetical protein
MFLSLEILVQANYIVVSCLLENHYFLHYFFGLTFLSKVSCVDTFYCYELLCNNLHSNIYLAKSPLTNHFTYSIKLNGCKRTFICLLKGLFDLLNQFLLLFLDWEVETILQLLRLTRLGIDVF